MRWISGSYCAISMFKGASVSLRYVLVDHYSLDLCVWGKRLLSKEQEEEERPTVIRIVVRVTSTSSIPMAAHKSSG